MDSDRRVLGGLSCLKGELWDGGSVFLRFFVWVEVVGKIGVLVVIRC